MPPPPAAETPEDLRRLLEQARQVQGEQSAEIARVAGLYARMEQRAVRAELLLDIVRKTLAGEGGPDLDPADEFAEPNHPLLSQLREVVTEASARVHPQTASARRLGLLADVAAFWPRDRAVLRARLGSHPESDRWAECLLAVYRELDDAGPLGALKRGALR